MEFCSWKQGFRDSDWNLGGGGTRQESSEARRAGRSGRSKKAIHKRKYSAILSVAEWHKKVGTLGVGRYPNMYRVNLRWLVAVVVVGVVVEIQVNNKVHTHFCFCYCCCETQREG